MIGEAIAAEDEVSKRTGSILKGSEGRMVEAVIVTEEECKEDRTTPRYQTEPTHSNRATYLHAGINRKPAALNPFLQFGTSQPVQYGTSQSVQDGLLPVHPLVLDVPETFRAATLTIEEPRPDVLFTEHRLLFPWTARKRVRE